MFRPSLTSTMDLPYASATLLALPLPFSLALRILYSPSFSPSSSSCSAKAPVILLLLSKDWASRSHETSFSPWPVNEGDILTWAISFKAMDSRIKSAWNGGHFINK